MNKDFVWCIAYIRSAYLSTIDGDIEKSSYPNIRAAIPKVRILRKQFKNHQFFTEVPLLFNYGFFKLPLALACSISCLKELKNQIQGIHGWLYKAGIKDDMVINEDDLTFKRTIKLYTVTNEEVMRLMRIAKDHSIYHSSEINSLKLGSIIQLKGYPFDGMTGEILEINDRKEEAKIRIALGTESKNITISFGNLFYSIYEDFYGISLDSDKNRSFNEDFYGNKT